MDYIKTWHERTTGRMDHLDIITAMQSEIAELRAVLEKTEHTRLDNQVIFSENELQTTTMKQVGTVKQKPGHSDGNFFVLWTHLVKPSDKLYIST